MEEAELALLVGLVSLLPRIVSLTCAGGGILAYVLDYLLALLFNRLDVLLLLLALFLKLLNLGADGLVDQLRVD